MKQNTHIYVVGHELDQQQCSDLLCRLSWYFFPYLSHIDAFHVPSHAKYIEQATLAGPMDPVITDLLPHIKEKVTASSPAKIKRALTKADPASSVMLLHASDLEDAYADLLVKFRRQGAFFRADANNDRLEGSYLLWAGLNNFVHKDAEIQAQQDRFAEVLTSVGQHDKAYVFGTGPSLGDFVEQHDFSDGLTIIANSIVKNHDFLERLAPKLITAADPIFHAGCSSYAAAFRSALIEAMMVTGAYFVCPLRDLYIYRTYLPPELQDKIIGIPFNHDMESQVDLALDFQLKPYPNILTLLLLPLAATFARSIHIAGCDGRPLTEDDSFWSHDAKAQFVDEMENIKKVHPGFFAIDYNDYYFQHAIDLETSLSRLESVGKTCINETRSFVPALNSRQLQFDPAIADPHRPFEPEIVAIIDPDARGNWGHYLAYDQCMAEAVKSEGHECALICRRDLDPNELTGQDFDHVVNQLGVHSWVLGNKWPDVNATRLRDFAVEIEQAIDILETTCPDKDIVLFMYCGSIEVVEILEYILIYHPRTRAVINLFWSYNFDIRNQRYQERYAAIFRRVLRPHSRVKVTHSTAQMSVEFEQVLGTRMAVLPHPSTTFSDAKLPNAGIRPTPAAGKPFKVLFPGGARPDKGYQLALDTCQHLSGDTRFNLELRTYFDDVTDKGFVKAAGQLPDSVSQVDNEFSPDDFVAWLASADIIVVPYLPSAFASRTSGMLVDAFLLGIPVVVIEDTWLADEVAERETGIAVAAEVEDLCQGIEYIAENYEYFTQQVAAAGKAYASGSNWHSLVQQVVDAATVRTSVRAATTIRNQTTSTQPKIPQPKAPLSKESPALSSNNQPSPKSGPKTDRNVSPAAGRSTGLKQNPTTLKPIAPRAYTNRTLTTVKNIAEADVANAVAHMPAAKDLSTTHNQPVLAELESANALVEELKAKLLDHQTEAADQAAQLQELKLELETRDAQSRTLSDELAASQSTRTELKEQLTQLNSELTTLQAELTQTRAEYERQAQSISALEQQKQRTAEQLNEQIEQKEQRLQERNQTIVQLKKAAQTVQEEHKDAIRALNQSIQELEAALKRAESLHQNATAEIDSANSQVALVQELIFKEQAQPSWLFDTAAKHYREADARILLRAKAVWEAGAWDDLTLFSEELPGMKNYRDVIALLVASAYTQLGNLDEATIYAKQAQNWGASYELTARVLLSSSLNSLGCAAALLEHSHEAQQLFEESLGLVLTDPQSMTPALARSRQLHQKLKLGLIADIATDLHQQLEELRVNNKVGRTEAATLKDQIDMINTHLSYQQRRSRISKRLDQPTDLLMRGSTSQLGQDLWVLRNSNYKKHGFFVEFGATDGLMLSNTWLLEKDYEWQGICAEPNPHFYKQLAHNRQCITSMDCITDATGDLVEFVLADEYSGITDHAFEDSHKDKRQAFKSKGDTISLRTISLHDFLLKHDAPRDIDYISIDTEGSEYTILKAFPFAEWNVRMFSIEHNFTPQRQLIRELMTQHGYVCEEMQFDDWYVRG